MTITNYHDSFWSAINTPMLAQSDAGAVGVTNVVGGVGNNILASYYPIFLFMVVAFGLSAIVLLLSRLAVKSKPYRGKNAPYECGFPAFAESRHQFDVRFYLVSILFIIFDLEVAFLFPWVVSLKALGGFGFYSMMLFLLLLTIGFLYEWKKGALDWE